MQLLVKLYDKTLQWAQHKNAPRYLAAVSFVEASVFPIPPYFMLAPMALSKPDKAYSYATVATVASVMGGVLGYLLGYLVFNPIILPVIQYLGYERAYEAITTLFQERGFIAVLIAGFLPMPFKVVAIASGFMQVSLPLFIVAAAIGRGMKFFAIATLMKFGGAKMEDKLRQIISKMGVVFVILTLAVLALKIFKVI